MSATDFRQLPGGGVLVLGQDQDSPGERFDETQSLSGKVTQFGMWRKVLNQSEIT